jgi:hypothetical protein
MWPRDADPWSRTPLSTTGTAFWNPTPYSTDTSYDLKHPSLQQGCTSDSETPLDTFYELEPHSLQQVYTSDSETPLFTARIHLMI